MTIITMETTPEKLVATMQAIASTIKELRSIPNGHLYAQLMDKVDFETYTFIIHALKEANLIVERFNVLIWVLRPNETTQSSGLVK